MNLWGTIYFFNFLKRFIYTFMFACNYHTVLEIETRASDMGSKSSTIKLISYLWFLLIYFPQGSWCYLLRGLWWLVEWEMEEKRTWASSHIFPFEDSIRKCSHTSTATNLYWVTLSPILLSFNYRLHNWEYTANSFQQNPFVWPKVEIRGPGCCSTLQ